MPTDSLSTTFAALADPTRRAILARLAAGECSVTELAQPFDMSLPGVSKHLRVLERAGLIRQGREAQWRPCRIEAGPLKQVSEWADRYRHISLAIETGPRDVDAEHEAIAKAALARDVAAAQRALATHFEKMTQYIPLQLGAD